MVTSSYSVTRKFVGSSRFVSDRCSVCIREYPEVSDVFIWRVSRVLELKS